MAYANTPKQLAENLRLSIAKINEEVLKMEQNLKERGFELEREKQVVRRENLELMRQQQIEKREEREINEILLQINNLKTERSRHERDLAKIQEAEKVKKMHIPRNL